MGEPPRHEQQKRRLAEAIERAGARPGPPFECPYLEGREARHLALRLEPHQPGLYHALMDLNFRRLGEIFYRPQCGACDACRMIRLPVAEFRPNRAQRRCRKRNADLDVRIAVPRMSDEKQQLYKRYLRARHDGQMDGSPAELRGFLYSSPVDTLEVSYFRERELIAVGIADAEPGAMSAVYCYFDPAESSRSLGVFNVLTLLDECRRRDLPFLYLGYYVRGCGAMDYKADYLPCEILEPGRGFVRYDAAPPA